jgi:hypothetical protein
MKRILPLFSYVFHPLLTSVYATLFYFVVTQNFFYQHEIYLVFIQVLILTLLLPVSIYYLLSSLGLLKSKMQLDKKERRLPLACHAVLLFILIKQSFSVLVIPELYYFFVGSLVSTMLALTLALFNYKASLHMIGVTLLTFFVVSISIYYHMALLSLVAFFIVCIGFTASSRLDAKAHTYDELILGFLLGALPQVGLWYIWLLPSM